MVSLAAIRDQRRSERVARLRQTVETLLVDPKQQQVWLFGSLARNDWDAYSDVDLLAVAPDQAAAENLADLLREACLADDVIALSQERWLQHQDSHDPWWRSICRDAIPLAGGISP